MYVCLYIHVCGVVQAQARTPCWKKKTILWANNSPKRSRISHFQNHHLPNSCNQREKPFVNFPPKIRNRKKEPQKIPILLGITTRYPYLLDLFLADNQPGNHPHPNPPLPPTPVVLWSFPPVLPGHQSQTWRNLRVPGARGMMEWGDFLHFPRDDQMTNPTTEKMSKGFFSGLGMGPRTTWEWLAIQQATRNNKRIERNTNGQEEGIFW